MYSSIETREHFFATVLRSLSYDCYTLSCRHMNRMSFLERISETEYEPHSLKIDIYNFPRYSLLPGHEYKACNQKLSSSLVPHLFADIFSYCSSYTLYQDLHCLPTSRRSYIHPRHRHLPLYSLPQTRQSCYKRRRGDCVRIRSVCSWVASSCSYKPLARCSCPSTRRAPVQR